jgi:hypothetical protein
MEVPMTMGGTTNENMNRGDDREKTTMAKMGGWQQQQGGDDE